MTYNRFGQLVTMIFGPALTTFTYDNNGSMTLEHTGAARITMAYTPENRMKLRIEADGARMTSVYDGDGLRRVRANAGGVTTFIWDGADYLAEQN